MEMDSDFIAPPAPERPQDLGPEQIKWCRLNIPAFNDAWRAVKKADEHSQRVRERLEGAQS